MAMDTMYEFKINAPDWRSPQMDGGGFYSDDEDFGGQIVYGDSKPLDDFDSQSQDDRDLNAAVHTKFNVAARKRLGLGRRGALQTDLALHLGSEDLEEQLRQQPPKDFKQGLQGILEGLNASEASEGAAAPPPPPPPARRALAPPAFPSRRAPALPTSPLGPTAASPGRSLGTQLTAGSQLGGAAGASGGGAGAPRSSANPFGIDIEMAHIFNYHNTTMRRTGPAPRGGGRGRRAGGGGGGRQHRHFAQTQAAAAAAAAAAAVAAGGGLATPRGTAAAPNNARADPLAALLASGGRGGGSGARGGRPTPSNNRPRPLRVASQFRQPALGTPGHGHGTAAAGAGQGGAVAMDAIEAVEDADYGFGGPATGAGAMAGTTGHHPPPPVFETPRSAPQTGQFDSPAGGSNGAGSGARVNSGQDAFLAGLAPPSARQAAGRQRSRMAGGAPNSLQARLKRTLEADESVAVARQQVRASAATASAGRGALEATVQAREMEMGVCKVHVIVTSTSEDPEGAATAGPAFFFIPGHIARDADLAPGKRMRVSPPWRQIRSQGGSTYVMCSGAVETLSS